jgi:hypothetical protein
MNTQPTDSLKPKAPRMPAGILEKDEALDLERKK